MLAALPEEAAALRRRLHDVSELGRLPCTALDAQLGAARVVLAVTGMGERNARRALSALLSRVPVQRLLVIGVSGALSHGLSPGALLVGEHVVSEAGDVHDPDPALLQLACEAAPARRAVLVSASELADSPRAKHRLWQLPSVAPADAAVDLESAAFAAVAAAEGIPWLCLRAISDGAEESLPSLLNGCREPGGNIRRGAVVLRLLADPRPLPALLELRRRVWRASRVLGQAVESVLQRFAATAATEKERV